MRYPQPQFAPSAAGTGVLASRDFDLESRDKLLAWLESLTSRDNP